jgi:hypothetical protein
MALAYDTRRATRDIDAVFAPKAEIYECAAVVGQALGLSDGWRNDAVKRFLPTHAARPGVPDPDAVPVFDEPGLRVMAAWPRYLLAMKRLASRREDQADILWLCRHLRIACAGAGGPRRPLSRRPDLPRARFPIEELLGDGA